MNLNDKRGITFAKMFIAAMFIVILCVLLSGCTMIRVDRSVNLDLQDCHVSVSSNSVSASLTHDRNNLARY